MDSTNMNVDDIFFDFLEKSSQPHHEPSFLPPELEDIFSPCIPNAEFDEENGKLKQENLQLRKRSIDQESLLAQYERKLSQRMEEYFEMKKCVEEWKKSMESYENEVSGLKLKIEQLQAENYQYKNLKMLNNPDSIEQMKKEITNKTNAVSKLKNQLVMQKRKFSENKKLCDSLMKHITCLWGYLIDIGEVLSSIGLWNGTQKRMLETEFIDNIKILGDIKLKDDKDILEVLNAINAVSIEESDSTLQRILCGQPYLHDSPINQFEAVQKPVVSSSVPSPPLSSPLSCVSSPAVLEENNSSYLQPNVPEICKEKLGRTPSLANSSENSLNDLTSNKVSNEDKLPKRILDCPSSFTDCKRDFSAGSDYQKPPVSKEASVCEKLRNPLDVSKTRLDPKKDSLQVDLKPFEKTKFVPNFDDSLNEDISLAELYQLKFKIGLPEDFVCLSPLPPTPPKKRRRNAFEEKVDSNLKKQGSVSILPLHKTLSCDESDSQDIADEDFDHSKDIYQSSDTESPPNYNHNTVHEVKNTLPNNINDLSSSNMNLAVVKKEESFCDTSYNIKSCIASNEFNSDVKTSGMLSNKTTISACPKVILSEILNDEKAKIIVESELGSSKEISLKSSFEKELPEVGENDLTLPISKANHLSSYQVVSSDPTYKLSNNSSESVIEDSVLTPKQSIQKPKTKAVVKCKKEPVEKTSISVPTRVRGRTLLKSQIKKDPEKQENAKDEVEIDSNISQIPENSDFERPRKVRKEHKRASVTESTIHMNEVEKHNSSMNITLDGKNKLSNSLEPHKSVTVKNTQTVINGAASTKNCLRSHKLEKVKKLLNSDENAVLVTRLRSTGLKNSKTNRTKRKNKRNKMLQNKMRKDVKEQNVALKQKKRKKGKMKIKGIVIPNPIALAFKGLQEMRETCLPSLQAENCLYDVLVDPANVPNTATLLFYVIQFLLSSKYQSILCYVRTNGSSELIPVEEHCIVRILLKIEESNKPHLEKLLVSAVNTLHQIILSKTKLMLYPLSSLCRVLTLICYRKQSPLKPLSLCCDLLKTKNKLAPYLIASVAAVWKDIFQVSDEMSNEEKIFHCAIAYGAQKNINFNSEAVKKAVEVFLKGFLSSPNVPDINKIVEFLINKILIICNTELSPELEYALTSPLIIFAVYGNWSWTKEFLLDKYIIPCIKKYGKTEVNVEYFNIFCNLYVEIFSMSPDDENEELLTSIFKEGNTLVHNVTAIALMKLHLLQKKSLPSALFEWCEKNQNNPMIPSLEVLLQRKVASNDCITLNDIV